MEITERARGSEAEEEQNPKKPKITQQQEVDWISQLPDDILHPILSLLTLKEACITSALSKRWRHLFPSLPRLRFDYSSFCYSWRHDRRVIDDRGTDWWLVAARDTLESRRSPVRNCTIRSYHFDRFPEDFGNIISFLCNDSIQELTVYNDGRQHFTIPSCLYICRTLTRIELYRCMLKVPSRFSRLRLLNTLMIEECTVEDVDMHRLILGCMAVERLTLLNCHGLRNLAVDADKLSVLDVTTHKPLAVSIVNAPRLESVTVRFLYDFDDDFWTGDDIFNDTCESEGIRLVRLIESLGNIQNLSLELQNTYMKGSAVPVTLQSPFPKMKKLNLIVQPYDTSMLSVVSCLLNSCPNLEELVIGDNDGYDVYSFIIQPASALVYWDQQIPSDCMRNTLSNVTLVLKDREYWEYWIKFAKFLVNNACVLKNLVIDGYRRDKSGLEDFRMELLQVHPASPDVVVELKADRRVMFPSCIGY